MKVDKHENADKTGLSLDEFWEAFRHEHERRTGLGDDLDKDDDMTRYYSPSTTPTKAVDWDIDKCGLEELQS